MALESGLRQKVLELLKPLHAISVEPHSGTTAGTPDVNCIAGWIELKSLDEWPVRPGTIVRPPHFEPEQRHFLDRRCEMGGAAWLLLRVNTDWLLVWGARAAKHLGVSWTAQELRCKPSLPGVVRWTSTPSGPELIKALLMHPWRLSSMA